MHGGPTSSAWIFQRDSLFSRREVRPFSPGGFESLTSSIPAGCCGMWHNGALGQLKTRWFSPSFEARLADLSTGGSENKSEAARRTARTERPGWHALQLRTSGTTIGTCGSRRPQSEVQCLRA